MPYYVEHSTQTHIKDAPDDHKVSNEATPESSAHSDLPTSPPTQDNEDAKAQSEAEDMTADSISHGERASNLAISRQLQHKKRSPFNARISMPSPGLDYEGPRSPTTTHMPQSPLPAANRLHAGHTPIVPRSRSPLGVKKDQVEQNGQEAPEESEEQELQEAQEEQEEDNTGESTPVQDNHLTGALTLPANPGDATNDRIEVKALDAELEKIAREQQQDADTSSGPNPDQDGQNTRRASGGTGRRSSADEVEEIDGVILKKNNKLNMGAPLGQAA